jgi:hypothetical protein
VSAVAVTIEATHLGQFRAMVNVGVVRPTKASYAQAFRRGEYSRFACCISVSWAEARGYWPGQLTKQEYVCAQLPSGFCKFVNDWLRNWVFASHDIAGQRSFEYRLTEHPSPIELAAHLRAFRLIKQLHLGRALPLRP